MFQFSLFGVTNANLGNSQLKSAAERAQENIFSASHVRRAGQTDMSTVEYKLVRSMWALIYKRTTSLLLLASSMRDKHNRTNRSPREWNSRLVARINQSNYLLGLRNTFERTVSRDQHPRHSRRKKGATNHNNPSPLIHLFNTKSSSSSVHLSDNQLLLLTQPLRNLHRDLQRRRHDLRRRQRQPLRQRNVHHAVALVDFDPLQSLVGGRVFDIVPGVVREDGRVAGGEVEGAGGGVADEGGGASGAGQEVEPFFGLGGSLLANTS